MSKMKCSITYLAQTIVDVEDSDSDEVFDDNLMVVLDKLEKTLKEAGFNYSLDSVDYL